MQNTYYYDFEFNFINIILKFIGFKIINNNKLMCSEYISYILTKLNIIKNNFHASCLPCYFDKKFNTYNNFYYSDIEYFIYLKWFDEFNDVIDNIKIVYIKTSPEVSYKRVIKRQRIGENISLDYLKTQIDEAY